MKKLLSTLFVLLALSNPALALNSSSCQNQAEIKVNGLVCDFCARAINKVFSAKPQVSNTDVDLENGRISIIFNANQNIEDDELKKLIINSGYDVVAIERSCK
jgi:copper chaperone CopZ